jgi:integrase
MAYEIKDLPKFSIQNKRDSLYAFFIKPWDDKQTSVKVLENSTDKAEATRLAPSKIITYLNLNNPTAQPVPVNETNMAALVDSFLADEKGSSSYNTRRIYKGDIRKFIKHMAVPHAEDITWERFRDYMDAQRDKRKAKGLTNYAVNLAVFFDYLIAKGAKVGNWPRKWKKPTSDEFGSNDRIVPADEFGKFHKVCTPRDQRMLTVFYHTGLNPVDYYHLRKSHIVKWEGDFIINKRRQKSTSKKAVINMPLKYNPARDIILEAADKVGEGERIFETEYADTEYRRWWITTSQRLLRLWKANFAGDSFGFQDLRHTFATECANGTRFGRMIPEWQLEPWMGWVPGSRMGAKHYISAKANPDLMKPQDHLASIYLSPSSVIAVTNFQDRLPFT